MNLIQQLQQTPKWKEFEGWYNGQLFALELYSWDYFGRWMIGLNELDFPFQKGVFEKFIESQEGVFEQEHTGSGYCYSIWDSQEGYDEFNSFEELLIWYFNN